MEEEVEVEVEVEEKKRTHRTSRKRENVIMSLRRHMTKAFC